MNVDPHCSRCGASVESPDHIILHCPFTKAAWFGSLLAFRVPADDQFSIQDWIEGWHEWGKVGKKRFKELSCYCTFLAWSLWLARNALMMGRAKMKPQEVLQAAATAYHEFLNCLSPPHSQDRRPNPMTSSIAAWQPPQRPFILLTTDASWSSDQKVCGLGIILRDSHGALVFAKTEINSFDSIVLGEALAIRLGLLEAISEDVQFLKVESNNQQVISYINNKNKLAPLTLQPVIADILHVATYFSECVFTFIPREANVVADSLARKALSTMRTTVWPLSTPWLKEMCNLPTMCSSHLNE
ncbi:uncharacterized protein LOC122665663 [Telopea speciosissima]|uniref:uncharacterized protein LOC122665663 n=1 Tax=Telopea speciosissima TaxID=54955 RepID=UPI001CC3C92E|nr:uncharacterized protein LOC122665663 [Telopea speciosissima]